MKIPILATGLSGLVGTRVAELLSDRFEFEDLSFETGVDITDSGQLKNKFAGSSAKVVLHLAAKTDVDACEDDKQLGEEGGAWQVNAIGTQNIVEACRETGKRVIYISTDFVFDGTKKEFKESDEPNPINWYSVTKHEGEKFIHKAGGSIIRISYPYRAFFSPKKDFLARILDLLREGKTVTGLTDHIFTPTFIDDIAQALSVFMTRDLPGTYHVVGSSSLTIYEAIKLIAKVFQYKAKIDSSTRSVYFKDRAFRPFCLKLNNDKIKELGIYMRTFDEGLSEVKNQLQMYYNRSNYPKG